MTRRALALASLSVALVAVAAIAFPQCLADPYAALDPRLKEFWLGSVTEAQSFLSLARNTPALLAGYYATPLLALALLAARFARLKFSRAELVVAAFLVAGVVVSLWQVRGAMFSLPLAAIPLAAWVARRRLAAQAGEGNMATLKMAAAWLLSFAVVWAGAADAIARPFGTTGMMGTSAASCYQTRDYAALAALAPATVLSVSNLGPAILANTGHRVLSGPYHRNVAGNLVALDAFMKMPDEARRIFAENDISLLAHCPGNAETQALAAWAPKGLAAELDAGHVPAWLEPVADASGGATGLRIFRYVK